MALLPFQPKRVRFSDVLLAIRDRIVDTAAVQANKIGIVARDEPIKSNAEKLVFLRPRRYTIGREEVDSAGRLATVMIRQLDVIINSRAALDKPNSDQVWLTDAGGRGYFDLEEDVLNSLQEFFPVDSDGNNLTIYPIRIFAGSQPDIEKEPGWGAANATFEVAYMPPVSLVDILPHAIADGTAGTALTQSFTTAGAEGMTVVTAPLWSLGTAGTLPPGVSQNTGTGRLTGTPTLAGYFSFVAVVTDTATKLSGWHRYNLRIAIGIAPTTMPGGTHNVAYATQTLTPTGHTGTCVWSVAPGYSLPAGLVLTKISATEATVSGTPTTAGTFVFKIRVEDARKNFGERQYSVVIA